MENEILKTSIEGADETPTKPKKRKNEESVRLYREAIKRGESWRGRPPVVSKEDLRETLSLYVLTGLKRKIEAAARKCKGAKISEVGELALEFGLERAVEVLKRRAEDAKASQKIKKTKKTKTTEPATEPATQNA